MADTQEENEKRVLYAALDSFRQYRRTALQNFVVPRRASFYSLPDAHVAQLSKPPYSLPELYDCVESAIDANADVAEAILQIALESFGVPPEDTSWHGTAKASDLEKASCTIRQCFRDWSVAGKHERDSSYGRIQRALEEHLPPATMQTRHRFRILVPGSGLGRQLWDLCAAGYTVEGNEISFHQLMASNYILNYCSKAGQHKIFPFALSFENNQSRSGQLRAVYIPDVHPAVMPPTSVPFNERMQMVTGDFCSTYRKKENSDAFNAVATCFFIDTAPNLLRYIEAVKNCLKPGGIWVNLGPLLWHFVGQAMDCATADGEGIAAPGGFELSNDLVISLVKDQGFIILEQDHAMPQGFLQDPASMRQTVYRPGFWVAKKK
ncbi:N2227-domain-containing protein [Piedraia hortae CBS 480.64]|uniref:carnosine N-methyltransferase n=1 Tax=Piedraia hortae CBS 480.64 TaxID=1314780 RepID=A0A6A7BYV6_9PEZI|nr:N2227-domain-containing protein [Piedraia hortae CBS 480.64]